MPVVNAVAPFEGRLHWVGDVREGQSQTTGNEWKQANFVLAYTNHQMQEAFIAFSCSGVDRVNKLLSLPLGTLIKVSFIPSARSYTDQEGKVKWFGSNDAISINPVQGVAVQPAAYPPQDGIAQPTYPQQGTQIPGRVQRQPQYQPQQPAYQPQAPAYQPTSGYPQPGQPVGQVGSKEDLPFD